MIFVFDGKSASASSYVQNIWHTRSVGSGSFISSAAANWEMVITRQAGGVWLTVRGPETKATPAPVPADAEFFGISFKLGTYMPHLPGSLLVNGGINLPDASSKSFWLKGEAWQFPSYDNADIFIDQLIRAELLAHDEVVEGVLQDQPAYASIRTVRRRFLHTTGLPYKTIQQIERARQASTLLQQGKPILDTVYETGYFDQAHMTKALKYFIGQTPAQILRSEEAEQTSFGLTASK
ncbi:MAG: helix-turn-helix domain-containing protein [Chloroflexota bacterium]